MLLCNRWCACALICLNMLLSYDPSLIYNFIYRTPFSLVTSIYDFFTAKELGISYTLCRSVRELERSKQRA